ncbi:dmX-like protein 1 [Daktulosphaira vitifoliae]|uniref:dmX-like protein 1 n=1 Tax=Daktulosphaira vitifoliae TaxID=58002 RepID=UPI0021AABB74|nr:dmX-like protein 1 [Daktulosphaira vitifoliae]
MKGPKFVVGIYCNIEIFFVLEIWNLSTHQLMYTFPAEHARSSFFKHIGQGVTQLHVDSSARLFSCGADGSMKVRQLPDRYH